MNPGENLGIWLALMVAAVAITGWNLSRLRAARPVLDRLVALLGALAIAAVVIGTSLVATQVSECAISATRTCTGIELVLVGVMDLAVSAALITAWLRADACHATFTPSRVDPRRIPKTRRQRTVAGELRI
jgi:hypothetical protein